jgi:hypothetical protein
MSDSSLIVVKSVTDAHLVGAGCVGKVLEALAGGALQRLPVVILPPNLCVKIRSSSVFTMRGVFSMPIRSTRDIALLKDSWRPPEPDATGAGALMVRTLTPEGPIAATVVVVEAGSDVQDAR